MEKYRIGDNIQVSIDVRGHNKMTFTAVYDFNTVERILMDWGFKSNDSYIDNLDYDNRRLVKYYTKRGADILITLRANIVEI